MKPLQEVDSKLFPRSADDTRGAIEVSGPVEHMDMEEVGVAHFDDAFSKASRPLATTIDIRMNVADGRQAVNDTLEIPPELKTLKDGIVALKKKRQTSTLR